jgi:hypothetical protein
MEYFSNTVRGLLLGADDVTLFNEVGARIQDLVTLRGTAGHEEWGERVRRLPAEQRTVLMVWEAAIVENGGFAVLFQRDYPGDEGFLDMAAAFGQIGAARAAGAFAAALKVFAEHRLSDGFEERERAFRASGNEKLCTAERQYLAEREEIVRCVAAFIRAREEKFILSDTV